MPFLRVVRDKRGYETTYLMHWYREGARQHSRILYVFRSPADARVGRDPLEPEVLRQIEAQHPDIAFDWKVVRDNQQVVEATHEPRRRRVPRAEEPEPPVAAPPRPVETPQASPRPPIPSKIEGDTPDAQIAFLAEVYTLVRERISQRITDPGRQEVLLSLCERLNPAAWTDADQITSGLEAAAEALDRLSHVFARRRRRSRKKPRGGAEGSKDAGQSAPPADAAAGDADDSNNPEPTDTEESSSL